ncbi:MAG: leucyl aminopeptidase [Alphaproteobacteria bacterium]
MTQLAITFVEPFQPTGGTLVVGVNEERELTPSAVELDNRTKGAVKRAMAASRFKGRKGEKLDILGPAGLDVERIVLVGLGKTKDRDALKLQEIGGAIVAHLNGVGAKKAAVSIDQPASSSIPAATASAHIAFGAKLRAYRFDKYRTKEKEDQKPSLTELSVMSVGLADTKKAYVSLDKVADAVFFTRNLVSEPANVIYPESLAEECLKLADLGVEVEVLDVPAMKKLGMGSLLGVGQGSVKEPRLVVMQWKGGAKGDQPLSFIGKGVTFDTGGISIKPAGGMEEMKWDMGGAAAVIGLIKALAGRKAKINVVGVCGLVENMPSGNAQRPGDIVTSMSGQTIEVINTDAEGRLVLADALWYTQERFKPKFMIDLATLTGAIVVALGHEYAGLFANNDELADRIISAGKTVGEQCWRMPIGEAYDKMMNSDAADMKNAAGREGGSSSAANFLQRFVNEVPWVHLDIAGTAWTKKDSALTPKGATAFGVRLLNQLVADFYEGK